MNKTILLVALVALTVPAVAQPAKPTIPITPAMIGQAIQRAIDNSSSKKAAAEQAQAAQAAAEAKEKEEQARGKVCKDANGCPVLQVQGKEYQLTTSSSYNDGNGRMTYNIYDSKDGLKTISISEGPSNKPGEVKVYDRDYVFQDALNPKDQVKAYYNFSEPDGTPHGYTVQRTQQVNDSTYRRTEILHNMDPHNNVPIDSLRNEMMRDTKAVRQMQPELIKGQYRNAVMFEDKARN